MALADFRGGAVLVDYLDFGRGLSLSRQSVGGVQVLQIGGGTLDVDLQAAAGDELVINEAGVDANFRVEGDTDANLIFVDAGNDRVGIGTATPSVTLQVAGACTIDSALIVSAGGITVSDGASAMTDDAAVPLVLTNATTGTSFGLLTLVGADAALGADNDEVFIAFHLRDEAAGPTAAEEQGRITLILQNAEAGAMDSQFIFNHMLADSLTQCFAVGSTGAAAALSFGFGTLNALRVTLTQTDSTAEATLANDTVTSIAAAVSSAQANVDEDGITAGAFIDRATRRTLVTAVNDMITHSTELDLDLEALIVDVRDLKSFVNSLVDALQAHGICL